VIYPPHFISIINNETKQPACAEHLFKTTKPYLTQSTTKMYGTKRALHLTPTLQELQSLSFEDFVRYKILGTPEPGEEETDSDNDDDDKGSDKNNTEEVKTEAAGETAMPEGDEKMQVEGSVEGSAFEPSNSDPHPSQRSTSTSSASTTSSTVSNRER